MPTNSVGMMWTLFGSARMTMHKSCLIAVAMMGCACVPCHTARNPETGKQIQWPHRWTLETGPQIRGDALPALEAALHRHLQDRERVHQVGLGEDARCEDTARAMDVSYIIDEQQHLVFVQIDETPEKRCPSGPPISATDADGGPIVILQPPRIPLPTQQRTRYAVTLDGRVLAEYNEVLEQYREYIEAESAPDGGRDAGTLEPSSGEADGEDAGEAEPELKDAGGLTPDGGGPFPALGMETPAQPDAGLQGTPDAGATARLDGGIIAPSGSAKAGRERQRKPTAIFPPQPDAGLRQARPIKSRLDPSSELVGVLVALFAQRLPNGIQACLSGSASNKQQCEGAARDTKATARADC